MRAETYFKKTGTIYGDSYKVNFGHTEHCIRKFTDWERAMAWLHLEEHDFRTREFISKSEAIKRGYKEERSLY